MALNQKVDQFLTRAKAGIAHRDRLDNINLYAEGLKGKILQANIALGQLREMCRPVPTTMPPQEDFSSSQEQELVQFYCDAFWAFLYSSLDVLAHIINQVRCLGVDEREVSIKGIHERLRATENGTALQVRVDKLVRSRPFLNVERYRNCCLHRRQICIERRLRSITRTPGYTATGPLNEVKWLIAENPLERRPSMRQEREIPDYLYQALRKIESRVQSIVRVLP